MMVRLMGTMRRALLAVILAAAACGSPPKAEEIKVPDPDIVGEAVDKGGDPDFELAKRTHSNVRHYNELRRQGLMQQMVAMHNNIARTVDENFEVYRRLALDRTLYTPRNWAVASLGFSLEKRKEARQVLEQVLAEEGENYWIIANACLSLSVLADPDTDISNVIVLLSHGDPEVRTSAATCIKEVWRVSETPRKLTPQHYAAVDRLVGLLSDPATTRGRRAAAFALANLRHPEMLDYLVTATKDSDDLVQIGGLYGISLLGDARAIEPLIAYLNSGPGEDPASWAKKALTNIAVQNGFAKTPAEVDALGTNGKAWRDWFRSKRME